ncbi:hypothetical protein WOLCODRAFT_52926, partial [Wolfiporia cocos MD-104 SS10]
LPHKDNASYRSKINDIKNGYLQGTRVELLDNIMHWATDEADQPPILVLQGAAGTGKSTIAYEVAKRLELCQQLGGSFFFTRGDAELSTTEYVFPTLAYQLACLHDDFLPHITDASRSHLKKGGTQGLEFQLDELIIKPLQKIHANHKAVVLIIDAVDECTAKAQELVPHMLFLLFKRICDLRFHLRIFITTRPEMHIERAFESEHFAAVAKPYRLQDIPQSVVGQDIALYFRTELQKLSTYNALSAQRPDVIEKLTERAGGLFIYATTMIRVMRGDPYNLIAITDILTSPSPSASHSALSSELDSLYLAVLETALSKEYFTSLGSNYELVQSVFGAIALLEDHVSPITLSLLLTISGGSIDSILKRVKSVIYSDTDSSPIRPLHASFPQFLVNKDRCTNQAFYI